MRLSLLQSLLMTPMSFTAIAFITIIIKWSAIVMSLYLYHSWIQMPYDYRMSLRAIANFRFLLAVLNFLEFNTRILGRALAQVGVLCLLFEQTKPLMYWWRQSFERGLPIDSQSSSHWREPEQNFFLTSGHFIWIIHHPGLSNLR
jgi:hypothetical protein